MKVQNNGIKMLRIQDYRPSRHHGVRAKADLQWPMTNPGRAHRDSGNAALISIDASSIFIATTCDSKWTIRTLISEISHQSVTVLITWRN